MEIHAEQARDSFAEAVRRRDVDIDLFATCLFIAAEEYPDLDADRYFAKLDSLAGMVRDRLCGSSSTYDKLV